MGYYDVHTQSKHTKESQNYFVIGNANTYRNHVNPVWACHFKKKLNEQFYLRVKKWVKKKRELVIRIRFGTKYCSLIVCSPDPEISRSESHTINYKINPNVTGCLPLSMQHLSTIAKFSFRSPSLSIRIFKSLHS